MFNWWNNLDIGLQIFYGIAILSSFAVVIQLLMTLLIGGDADVADADVGAHGHHPAGLKVLSMQSITGFFLGFGWAGALAIKSGLSMPASIVIAMLCGIFIMAIIFYLMRSLYGLRYSGTLNYRNAIGKTATVYLPIPPNQSGAGQVEVLFQGRLSTVSALTNADEKLENRRLVKVVDIVGATTLLVDPIDHPS